MKCINCGNELEEDVDFCYFCGSDPTEKDNDTAENITGETTEKLVVEESSTEEYITEEYITEEYEFEQEFDYDLHGKNPVFTIIGNRGRRMVVYKNKCVLNVCVTLGSLITKNAADGEKTIYYKDVIGVQYKPVGVTIGFLQLETASPKGNNNSSNWFDENSFTFGAKKQEEVYKAYKYIIERLDEIKNS